MISPTYPVNPDGSPTSPSPSPSPSTPSTIHTISASAASAMHQHGCLFIDCRSPNLHAIERISGSICLSPSSSSSLRSRTVVVYDSGSTSPAQSFSKAGAAIRALLHSAPRDTRFCLLAGGLPAVRRDAPALLESALAADPAAVRGMTDKLRRMGRPAWAADALEELARSACPGVSVLPWLYLGSAADACKKERLERFGVSHVLVVAKELKPVFPEKYQYMHVEAEDTAEFELGRWFGEMAAFLEGVRRRYEAGEKACVLVHCFAGMSRSVATVVAYLIAHHGYSFQGALEMVRERRAGVAPDNFVPQLREWEATVTQMTQSAGR